MRLISPQNPYSDKTTILNTLTPLVLTSYMPNFTHLPFSVSPQNSMRTKGVVVGLGIGGGLATSSGLFATPEAAAGEIAAVAEAAANDNRGQLLLIVIAPAILWVLYNILQPALNQINKMRN
ncbi:hypothetical protein Ccrd_002257 [Cynara cardunculus var. scolymus]|uniref:Photosystem II PsbY n=1 Tax=Cynara cardunculus var. scolymus TaxID=59895 RepID=A0A118JWE6_CYNCS|nr:hypothetical protein Ccrd_002257 [Cynara cardunculus var. scolymus]